MKSRITIRILIIAIILAILVILANYVFSEVISTHWNLIKHVYIRNNILVKAELVKSEEKIELGLGGRESLSDNRGMLFEMPEDNIQHFWMYGMQFPIDIIWIEGGRVIGCEKNVQPDNGQRIFSSPSSAGYVLEVPAGFCDANRVQVNDEVKI